MALEPYFGYIKVDTNNRYTITENKCAVSGLLRNEDAYLYRPFDTNGDFEYIFECNQFDTGTDASAMFYPMTVQSAVDDWAGLDIGGGSGLCCRLQAGATYTLIVATELDSGTEYIDFSIRAQDTIWYCISERDESVGSYGTFEIRIYSDSAHTSLTDTVSVTLHTSKKDFPYLFCANSHNISTTQPWSGYGQNLDLQQADPAGLQDFTEFTEVDTGGVLTVDSATKITGDDVPRNVDAYTYDDKTAGWFPSDDWEIRFRSNYVVSNDNFSYCYLVTVANSVDDFQGIDAANGYVMGIGLLQSSAKYFRLAEVEAGTLYTDSGQIAVDTNYWVKLVRDSAVGTYGTLYAYVYNDASFTSLNRTLTLTLHANNSYRYLYAAQSVNSGGAQTLDFTLERMNVVVPAPTPPATGNPWYFYAQQ